MLCWCVFVPSSALVGLAQDAMLGSWMVGRVWRLTGWMVLSCEQALPAPPSLVRQVVRQGALRGEGIPFCRAPGRSTGWCCVTCPGDWSTGGDLQRLVLCWGRVLGAGLSGWALQQQALECDQVWAPSGVCWEQVGAGGLCAVPFVGWLQSTLAHGDCPGRCG